MKITALLFRIVIFTLLTRNFISFTILGRHAFDHHITNWRKWIYLNAWITRIFPQFSRRRFVIVVTDYLLHLFLSFCYLPPGEKSMSGYPLHVLNDLYRRCRNFATGGISLYVLTFRLHFARGSVYSSRDARFVTSCWKSIWWKQFRGLSSEMMNIYFILSCQLLFKVDFFFKICKCKARFLLLTVRLLRVF